MPCLPWESAEHEKIRTRPRRPLPHKRGYAFAFHQILVSFSFFHNVILIIFNHHFRNPRTRTVIGRHHESICARAHYRQKIVSAGFGQVTVNAQEIMYSIENLLRVSTEIFVPQDQGLFHREIKPYPFDSLNHFTVPVLISIYSPQLKT